MNGVGLWWWVEAWGTMCLAGRVGDRWWEIWGLWCAERERGAGAERVEGVRRRRERERRVVRMVAWLLMERFGVELKACLLFVEMYVVNCVYRILRNGG